MPILSDHSTRIGDTGSSEGATGNTSSQIFLSRGVAGSEAEPTRSPSPSPRSPTCVTSIFESTSAHFMNFGDASVQSVSPGMDGEDGSRIGLGKGLLLEQSPLEPCQVPSILLPRSNLSSPRLSGSPSALSDAGDYMTAKDLSYGDIEGQLEVKGKGKAIERGRSQDRQPRYSNPLERAESRGRRNNPAIEINVRPIRKRTSRRSSTFFEDPNDPRAVLEDNLLEPCPHLPICNSVSEILHGALPRVKSTTALTGSDTANSLMAPLPPRALTTVFSDCKPLCPQPTVPAENDTRIRPDITHLENFSVNTSPLSDMYSWPQSPRSFAPPSPPPSLASQLPAEVLHQILYNLSPSDFNSARHTCRSWFIHSLSRRLLETMLQRMGFSEGIHSRNEWFLSKRLARECAIGPDWRGLGIPRLTTRESQCNSAFIKTSSVDFTEVAVHYPGSNYASTSFTVSSCGKFLIVANGCLVYIYELNSCLSYSDGERRQTEPGSLRPVTSIICPRRVLACSMDTSSQRYAIAILLDGRMGIVCDITALNANTSSVTTGKQSRKRSRDDQIGNSLTGSQVQGTSFVDRVSLNSLSGSRKDHSSPDAPFVVPSIAPHSPPDSPVDESGWQDVFRGDMPETKRTAGPSSRSISLPRARAVDAGSEEPQDRGLTDCEVKKETPMPIENGPRSIYRNLCSEDDPPRSVAICPQRRCVAFGCSSGIELHWVDALTGQDLNRWFPLTAPSDHLFFLPPRRNVDSAKKLRLISSAASPNERPAIADRQASGRSRTSPYWEGITRALSQVDDMNHSEIIRGSIFRHPDISRGLPTGRADSSDHYRAVPLSDGHHILFTDPTTGFLCLGNDAPVGGPTKLLRKIWFQGPEGKGSPVAYVGGADLSSGVRIIAAYGTGEQQSIWLFSVPSDIFLASQNGSSPLFSSSLAKTSTVRNLQNAEWVAWWPDDGLQQWLNHTRDPVASVLPRSVWPIRVRGQMIGTCNGLIDLTINSGPHMTIWAFGTNGMATVWKIDNGVEQRKRSYHINRDGTVKENDLKDAGLMGDFEFPTPGVLVPPLPLVPETFDGTASYPVSSLHGSRVLYRHFIPCYQCLHPQVDADGDVIMTDMSATEHEIIVEAEEISDNMVLVEHSVFEARMRKLRRMVMVSIYDRVDDVFGITRLDLEIH